MVDPACPAALELQAKKEMQGSQVLMDLRGIEVKKEISAEDVQIVDLVLREIRENVALMEFPVRINNLLSIL
jgi:hypothetical protein